MRDASRVDVAMPAVQFAIVNRQSAIDMVQPRIGGGTELRIGRLHPVLTV